MRSLLQRVWVGLALVAWIGGGANLARGGFAGSVVSYTPGTGIAPEYQNASASLGMPAGDTSFGVLTPFSAAFLGSHIVGIGQGGSLVLQLDAPAPTGAGPAIGIHAAVGMEDTDWPNGNAGPIATLYNNPRKAEVRVSEDGMKWHPLGAHTFQGPTNFYAAGVTTPGYQETPGTHVANFAQPFTATLSDFNGRTWPSILTLLDGSAGGTWLSLDDVPFPRVNFIRFDVTGAGESMYVDAVAVIPEPGAAFLGVFALLIPLWRRLRQGVR